MPEQKDKTKLSLEQQTKRLQRFMYDASDLAQIFGGETEKNESKSAKKVNSVSKKVNK